MNFLDGSLFPENQEKLVITAAPYGPEWVPSDFPQDIPVTMEAQIQKAVDCYNAGATVLHLHVRELDGLADGFDRQRRIVERDHEMAVHSRLRVRGSYSSGRRRDQYGLSPMIPARSILRWQGG